MEVIKYRYELWEHIGMYKTISEIDNYDIYYQKVNEMFTKDLFLENALNMISVYEKSCQTFINNRNINVIAFIGQSTAYFYCNSPELVTKEVFKNLSIELKNKNNEIAKNVINEYKRRMQKVHKKVGELWV